MLRRYRADVLHLRMAEESSLAAAEVARELGIPVVFTLAPDPHAVIHALDITGALHRGSFGSEDEREHYWFRARLVQRLADDSAHIVFFPRPDVQHDMRELLGLDVADQPSRFTVVPEGIDLRVSAAAAAELERPGTPGPALAELDALVAELPVHRRRLPLVISVGRLHRVKRMATLVEAWTGDAELAVRSNLLIVGGDLADPSPDEREQLDLIAEVLTRFPAAAAGLVMPGHRPNDVVAVWLAAPQADGAGGNGPAGVYVCSSPKEEFGLALVEALASGLIVVGPAAGGAAYLHRRRGDRRTCRYPPAGRGGACDPSRLRPRHRAGPGGADEPRPGAGQRRLHRAGHGRPVERDLRRCRADGGPPVTRLLR